MRLFIETSLKTNKLLLSETSPCTKTRAFNVLSPLWNRFLLENKFPPNEISDSTNRRLFKDKFPVCCVILPLNIVVPRTSNVVVGVGFPMATFPL